MLCENITLNLFPQVRRELFVTLLHACDILSLEKAFAATACKRWIITNLFLQLGDEVSVGHLKTRFQARKARHRVVSGRRFVIMDIKVIMEDAYVRRYPTK
jgi:hypothetical protein